MKSFSNMSCQSTRLLETILFQDTCNIWQGTICKLVMSYPILAFKILILFHLTTPGIFETGMYMTCILFQLPHHPNWDASWLNNGNTFHREGGGYKCIPRLLLSMRKRLIECINKGGGHERRYDLQYINL